MNALPLALLLGLRLFNPADEPREMTVVCNGIAAARTLAPHAVADFDDGCTADEARPLVQIFHTGLANGIEWQQLQARPHDTCPAIAPLSMPLAGCRFGSAIAEVAPVDGAAYSWSVDGGSIVSGAGTERIAIAIDGGDALRVSVAMTKNGCTTTAAGVMALRDAFAVKTLDAGSGAVGQPRTVTWVYANGEPLTQVLRGSDFAAPVVLPPDVRSYTYTPISGGDKEIVLDASLAPFVGHGRAAGRGTGSASSCNVAHARTPFHVDCARPDAVLSVPGSVGPGKPFTARVALGADATAEWTIVNGTPSTATGESVSITPAGTNPVDIRVTVTALGGCTNVATAHVVVTQSCDNPTATLFVSRNDCTAAAVQARFTGTPPFRGNWESGQPFLTSDFVLDRPVSASGTYAIQQFQDATCTGAGSSVSIAVKLSGVTLSAPNGFCVGPGTTAVATFSGTPPFSGTWSDGVSFSTSSNSVQRSVTNGGPLSMTWGDANCSGKTSSSLAFLQRGSAAVSFATQPAACFYYNQTFSLAVTVTGGAPPYQVTWSDGVVQTANASPIFRTVYPDWNGSAGITRVQDASCDLVITKASVSTQIVPPVYLDFSTYNYLCTGQQYWAANWATHPPGAVLNWRITNGTIVSGQGTDQIYFTPTAAGDVTVECDLTYGGCANSAKATRSALAAPPPPALDVSPLSVTVGQKVTIYAHSDAGFVSVSSSSANRPSYVGVSGPGTYLYTLTPTVKGNVTLTGSVNGDCGPVTSSVVVAVN